MLMERMRWSWDDLQNTPAYVRRYCVDFLGIRARVQAEAAERRQRQSGR
jgi:hypothetical protein